MIDWWRRLRGPLLMFVLLVVIFHVVTMNFRKPARVGMLQQAVLETLGPVMGFVHFCSRSIDDTIGHYLLLRHVKQENEQLRKKLHELQNKLTAYHEAFLENQRLRRLLDFQNTVGMRAVPAQVVVHDPSGWFQSVIVDKGEAEGVQPDMAVVNEEGVVGRVVDVSRHYSRVILITDPASAIDALVQRNRVRGILTGRDEKICQLRYVRSNLDVRTGDLVISSGKDGVFPKGLRLGIVREIVKDPVDLFQNIAVQPIVNPNSIEEVLIVQNREKLPRQWLKNHSVE